VGKKRNGVLTKQWLYRDQLHPVAELDGSGNWVARFVFVSGKNSPDLVIAGGVTYRVFTDQLGSPRVLVNASTGAVAGVLRHDAWGMVLDDSVSTLMPFGFAGGLYDAETGLVRFGARDYDAMVGRWVSKDPILFGGGQANIYVYVGNDPVNRRDPAGLEPLIEIPNYACERSAGLFGGPCGGPDEGDAYRHCVASCEITQRYGHTVATLLGALNELTSPSSAESDRDAGNNELGCGYGEDPDVDCSLRCYSAAINGELYASPGGDQGY
jgi:RHS repeat-associated protein